MVRNVYVFASKVGCVNASFVVAVQFLVITVTMMTFY